MGDSCKTNGNMLEAVMFQVFEQKKDMSDECYSKLCTTLKDFKEEFETKQANQPKLYLVKYCLTTIYIKKEIHRCSCGSDDDDDADSCVRTRSNIVTTIMSSVNQCPHSTAMLFTQGKLELNKEGIPYLHQGKQLTLGRDEGCMNTAVILSIDEYPGMN